MPENLPRPQRSELTPFGADVDRFFNRMFRNWPFGWMEQAMGREPRALRAFEHMPSIEVKENGTAYTVLVELPGLDDKDVEVTVELPGLDEKDVEVTFADGVLTLKGEKKSERKEEGKGFYLSERSYGSFQRSIALPEGVDAEKVSAEFSKGVLTVKAPKLPEVQSNVKKIAIKAS